MRLCQRHVPARIRDDKKRGDHNLWKFLGERRPWGCSDFLATSSHHRICVKKSYVIAAIP